MTARATPATIAAACLVAFACLWLLAVCVAPVRTAPVAPTPTLVIQPTVYVFLTPLPLLEAGPPTTRTPTHTRRMP